MKNLLFTFLVVAILLGFLSACENAEPILPEAPLCVKGEFRQYNSHCKVFTGISNGDIFDIRVYGHPELDSITVPDINLPEHLRVRGTRFYFQIDSTGTFNVCNALFAPTVPYYISNVSATSCGAATNN